MLKCDHHPARGRANLHAKGLQTQSAPVGGRETMMMIMMMMMMMMFILVMHCLSVCMSLHF